MIDGIISLLFFILEFFMLLGILRYNREHELFREIVILLSLLQLYQLSEFFLCIGVNPVLVSRIGYSIITFLPPMDMFAKKIANYKGRIHLLFNTAGLIFGLYYLIFTSSVKVIDCNPL